MDIGSILVIVAVALVVAAYIAQPLIEGGSRELSPDDLRLSALQAERDNVLDSLQEMDNDYAMGKIAEHDYLVLRSALVAQGSEALKKLDEWLPEAKAASGGEALDSEVEARIRLARQQGSRGHGFCPQCGKPLMAGDRYCSHCGAAVGASAVQA
jgi:hypothetical protein